jgi:hypothetical protein
VDGRRQEASYRASVQILLARILRGVRRPPTQEIRHHVLVGGALTNKPYFKELDPVVAFSEPEIMNQFNDHMKLKDILAKKPTELSEPEKAFVREHKSELTAEQTTAFASVFDESATEESEEGKHASEVRHVRHRGMGPSQSGACGAG